MSGHIMFFYSTTNPSSSSKIIALSVNSFIFSFPSVCIGITTLGLVSYMKTRLGLKPEEYDEKDVISIK